MKDNKKNYIIAGALFVLFVIFTYLVTCVDVQAVGPQNSEVGFATINSSIAKMLPYNEAMYSISEYLGYIAIASVAYFGLFGVMQLFIKKGFKKVDKDLYILAGLYACLLISYIVFEKIVINYRPVVLEEGLEASYPSSHTMMSIAFMFVAIQQFSMRLKASSAKKIVIAVSGIVAAGIIITRILAGVHWITDIIGAILLSMAWYMLYYALVKTLYKDRK